jgi:hypothetical protein
MPAIWPARVVLEIPRSRCSRIGMAGGVPANPPLNRSQNCRCRGFFPEELVYPSDSALCVVGLNLNIDIKLCLDLGLQLFD